MAAAPYCLPACATLGIWAPSGALREDEALARARQHFEALGHRVRLGRHLLERDGYTAGTVAQRLEDLADLLADPAVDLIMAARGGFGLSQLLPQIDWAACAASRKLFCGFSDFTAFQLGLYARTGQVSVAGPMATTDFGQADGSTWHADAFWTLLQQGDTAQRSRVWSCQQDAVAGAWEGPLWGGNLAMLTHLMGTPWWPDIEGGLLYIEDIAEAPYRIERMLRQLALGGVLARQQVLMLGCFTACEPPPNAPVDYRLAEVIARLRRELPLPVIDGLPFGHVRDKLSLPFGARARLQVDGGQCALAFAPFLSARPCMP